MTLLKSYNTRMSVGWLHRITLAVELSGRVKSELSKAAGFGVNYVSQMITEGKMPSGNRLARLCEELNVDQSWVLTGAPANPRLDRIVEIISELPTELEKTAYMFFSNREVSQRELLSLSDASGISLDDLRTLSIPKSEKQDLIPDLISPLPIETVNLGADAPDDVDYDVYAIAFEQALQIEENMIKLGVLSGPASSETRGNMVAMSYARELARKYAKKQ